MKASRAAVRVAVVLCVALGLVVGCLLPGCAKSAPEGAPPGNMMMGGPMAASGGGGMPGGMGPGASGGASGGGPGGPPAMAAGNSAGPEETVAPTYRLEAGGGGKGGGAARGGKGAKGVPAMQPRKLIRTADLVLRVDSAENALKRAEAIAREMGGFIGDTSLSRRPDGSQSGSVTVRVPVDRFEDALSKLRELGKVLQVDTKVQDVTAAFVDLEARLRNAKREEQEVLKLYGRSGRLADIIEVEERLAQVRENIEQLEGQMRLMRSQTDLSTIDVRLSERGEAAVPQPERYSLRYEIRSAARVAVDLVRNLITAAIYLVIVGWVVWVPVLLLIWLIWRRRRRRLPPPPPQTPNAEG
jgi:hypothetical protein